MSRKNESKLRKHQGLRLWLVVFLLTGLGLLLLVTGTTPQRVGPFGITLFFLLVFASLFSVAMAIRALFSSRSKLTALAALLLALVLSSILALNTIKLQLGDVILLVVFSFTVLFYAGRVIES